MENSFVKFLFVTKFLTDSTRIIFASMFDHYYSIAQLWALVLYIPVGSKRVTIFRLKKKKLFLTNNQLLIKIFQKKVTY